MGNISPLLSPRSGVVKPCFRQPRIFGVGTSNIVRHWEDMASIINIWAVNEQRVSIPIFFHFYMNPISIHSSIQIWFASLWVGWIMLQWNTADDRHVSSLSIYLLITDHSRSWMDNVQSTFLSVLYSIDIYWIFSQPRTNYHYLGLGSFRERDRIQWKFYLGFTNSPSHWNRHRRDICALWRVSSKDWGSCFQRLLVNMQRNVRGC